MAFEDINWMQEAQNIAGLVGDILFIPIDDVQSLPALPAAGDQVITQNLSLKSGKRWYRMYHVPETGKIDANSAGELDGLGLTVMLEFMIPGNANAIARFKRQILNTRAVWAYQETDGKYRLLGVSALSRSSTALTLDLYAHCRQANSGLGAARPDRRGALFNVVFNAVHEPLIYNGSFTDGAGNDAFPYTFPYNLS